MRPQGFAHAGFYPLTEGAAKIAADQVVVDGDPKMVSVLDPCVGDGVAIKIICDKLGIPYENIQAVELTRNRGEQAAETLPGSHVLAPCDFLSGCNHPDRGYTFVYANPPYADEIGGGYRVETQFLDQFAKMCPIGSVLLMVVPYSTATRRMYLESLAKSWTRIRVVRLGDMNQELAPFDETLVIAVRANCKPEWGMTYNPKYERNMYGEDVPADQLPGMPFKIPVAKRLPEPLHKVQLTNEEVCERLLMSAIEKEVRTPPPIDRGRPPLALTTGHNGILVASGQAPPVVTVRDSQGRMLEVPHLIRGVARKQTYLKSTTTEEDEEKGTSKTKTILSEAVDLKMLVLLHTGDIVDLNEQQQAPVTHEKPKMISRLPSDQGSGQGGIAI
jgi:hypothetical protein